MSAKAAHSSRVFASVSPNFAQVRIIRINPGGGVLDRRAHILELARRDGRVTVEALSQQFMVSTHTIRRDINLLCEEAKLRRLHGGAEFIGDRINLPYNQRAVLNYEAKRSMAKAAAAHVPDGATVFISIGTTLALVGEALAGHDSLTVVTNNMHAALALSSSPNNRIILPGGELRLPDLDFIDAEASLLFSKYRADFAIFGAGGIDLDGSLLDFNEDEVRAREEMRRNARHSVLIADRTKFGRRAAAVGGKLSDADLIVIDEMPGADFSALLAEMPGTLVVSREEFAA
jgi:DeoR family glycerol-3-phosphate regulon repressor